MKGLLISKPEEKSNEGAGTIAVLSLRVSILDLGICVHTISQAKHWHAKISKQIEENFDTLEESNRIERQNRKEITGESFNNVTLGVHPFNDKNRTAEYQKTKVLGEQLITRFNHGKLINPDKKGV